MATHTATVAAGPGGDAVAQLERLTALHDKGTITNDEFDRMKAESRPWGAHVGPRIDLNTRPLRA